MISNDRSNPIFPIDTIEKATPFEAPLVHPGGLLGSKTEYDINNGLFDQIISK